MLWHRTARSSSERLSMHQYCIPHEFQDHGHPVSVGVVQARPINGSQKRNLQLCKSRPLLQLLSPPDASAEPQTSDSAEHDPPSAAARHNATQQFPRPAPRPATTICRTHAHLGTSEPHPRAILAVPSRPSLLLNQRSSNDGLRGALRSVGSPFLSRKPRSTSQPMGHSRVLSTRAGRRVPCSPALCTGVRRSLAPRDQPSPSKSEARPSHALESTLPHGRVSQSLRMCSHVSIPSPLLGSLGLGCAEHLSPRVFCTVSPHRWRIIVRCTSIPHVRPRLLSHAVGGAPPPPHHPQPDT
ncbi:hypothetical protein CALCODRAFT_198391 [Calocera cornea HHB12733]|uniref:Uncharacterized protein n=1 Tax=Calocera cornea HHB12733 TaxID=1353952 RepID=A0A165HFF1_9BASI|nr:hypothetical protein CALCODRAFT_198391 [Calocera cornea HHB12733]